MAQDAGADYSFHDDVLERGTMFAVLFYALMTAFALSVLGGVMEAVVSFSPTALGYSLVFGGAFAYMFGKNDIYGLTGVAALPVYTFILALFLQSLPTIAAAGGGPAGTYVIVSAVSLLIGVVPAYLFRDTAKDVFRYFTTSVYGSSVIAVTAGVTQAIFGTMSALQGTRSSPQIVLQDNGLSAMAAGPVNLPLVFILILVLFNAPFLAYSREMDDFDPKYLALYLIPVLLYAVIQFFTTSLLQAIVA